MQYAYKKLRGRIKEVFGTQKAFAAALGVSQNCVTKKLMCKWEFSQSDVERWAKFLNIDRQEYGEFFYMRGGEDMKKKKKKQDSKAVRTPKKPVSVDALLDGKIIFRMNVSQKEIGRNPFTLY